ncbi:MAG: GNAT family N-acetyltransferase [Planctomycetota bacterium]
MDTSTIDYRETRELPPDMVLGLYRVNGWSSAEKPTRLLAALVDSHAVVSAWHGPRLVGLGNAISDGHLVVFYPHLLVHPDYKRRGIGTRIARRLMDRYRGFHQQTLLADGLAIDFYRKLGYVRAGKTEPMWVYAGSEH